jgi:hypothetical protein
MNKKNAREFLPLTLLFLAATQLPAQKEPTNRLTESADAIVIAEVQSLQQQGNADYVVLTVVRTVKGDLAPGSTVGFTWSSPFPSSISQDRDYGLWFLRRASDGQQQVVPVMTGRVPLSFAYFPMSRKSSVPKATGDREHASADDQVAMELANALKFYAEPSAIDRLAPGLLGLSDTAATRALYEAFRTSADQELKFIGLAGLVKTGDASALREIAENKDSVPKLHIRGLVGTAVAGWRSTDPVAIQYLGRIASSSDGPLQHAGAEALEYIHSRDAVPFLVQLLGSENKPIRELAIRGLSCFVNNLPPTTASNIPNGGWSVPQGPSPYRTPETDKYSLSTRSLGQADDSDYVQFWKSWWESHRVEVSSKPQ